MTAAIETTTDIVTAVRAAARSLVEAERRESSMSKSLEELRAQVNRRRLDLGRELVRARKHWPERGPKAKGWGDLLRDVGLEQQRAWELMKLAGYEAEISPHDGETRVPTLVEAGARQPPTLTLVPNPPDDPQRIAGSSEDRTEPKVDRNAWCTPKWLADALGRFDLDPCSNARSHIQARHAFDLELRGENGLELANEVPDNWRVFVNPPYGPGQVIEFVKAYARTRFCFLVRLDPSTEWFDLLDRATQLVAIPRRDKLPAGVTSTRIAFEPPPGVEDSSPDQNHVLMFAREEDASAAIRRMCRLYRKVQ